MCGGSSFAFFNFVYLFSGGFCSGSRFEWISYFTRTHTPITLTIKHPTKQTNNRPTVRSCSDAPPLTVWIELFCLGFVFSKLFLYILIFLYTYVYILFGTFTFTFFSFFLILYVLLWVVLMFRRSAHDHYCCCSLNKIFKSVLSYTNPISFITLREKLGETWK